MSRDRRVADNSTTKNRNTQKAGAPKDSYSKNRIIEFWVVMALLIVSFGGYAVYAGMHLFPEYEAVKNDHITLTTVVAWTLFLGIAYFLISSPFFHLVSANLKGKVKEPKTDYLVVLIRLIVFFVWIYVADDVYYNPEGAYDDVEKLISLGIIGGTIFAFDVIYFLVFTFIASTKNLAFSTRRKKKKKDENDNYSESDTSQKDVPFDGKKVARKNRSQGVEKKNPDKPRVSTMKVTDPDTDEVVSYTNNSSTGDDVKTGDSWADSVYRFSKFD